MAVSYMSPYIAASDVEIKLKVAADMFAERGRPVSVSTLVRLCRDHNVPMTKLGRANAAPWSQLLKLHRDWVHSQN